VGRFERGVIRLGGPLEETLEDLAEKSILIDEPSVNAGGRDAGPAGDLRDRRTLDSTLFENVLRRLQKAARRLPAALLLMGRPRFPSHVSEF
jgi:hypothetical protein